MVIGPADDARKPWDVLRGRIAIVEAIDGDEITVGLMSMSFRKMTYTVGTYDSPSEVYTANIDGSAERRVSNRFKDIRDTIGITKTERLTGHNGTGKSASVRATSATALTRTTPTASATNGGRSIGSGRSHRRRCSATAR